MGFPQYRKYKNGASYFIIHDEKSFTEYKFEQGRFKAYEFVAKILPDRNYISDMLNNYEPYWDKVDSSEILEKIGKP